MWFGLKKRKKKPPGFHFAKAVIWDLSVPEIVYSLFTAMSTSLQTSASSGQTLHTALSYCAISQYENTFYTTRTCFDLKQFPNCPFAEKSFLQACVWKLNTFLHCSFSAAYKDQCIPKCKRPTRIKEGTAGVSNSHIDQANCELIIAVNVTSMNGTPPSSCSRVLKVTFMSQKTLKRASLPTIRRV